MSDLPIILYEQHGDVAVLSLNRPEKMNSVGPGFFEALSENVGRARDDAGVHAIVITGEGRAFCAGADLSPEAQAFNANQPAQELKDKFPVDPGCDWPRGWIGMNIPKPVVCAVNGAAVGYGAELLATCDMRVAGQSARIGWVFARRGLVTDMGIGPVMLPRLIGMSQTARLLFSGEIVNADEALRIGLVDEVVPDADLRARAIELAGHLGSGAPNSIAVHKRQLYGTLLQHPHETYFENLQEFTKAMKSEDFTEGVRSFMEKRPPVWTGR